MTLGRSSALSFCAELIVGLAAFAATPYLLVALGAGPFGVLGLAAVLAGQLVGLHFGIGPAATRLAAQMRGTGDVGGAERIVVVALLLGLATALCVGGIFALAAPRLWIAAFAVSEALATRASDVVAPAALSAGAAAFLSAVHGAYMGHERFLALSTGRVLHGLTRVGAAVVAAPDGVVAVLRAQAVVDLVAAAGFALWLLRGRMPRQTFAALRDSGRDLLGTGLPFAAGLALAPLLQDAEKLAIGLTGSLADFAYYNAPFSVVWRIALIGGAVSVVILPRLSALVAGGDRPAAAQLVAQASRIISAASVLILAPLVAAAPELLELWLGSEAARSATAIRIVAIALFAHTAMYAAGTAVRALDRPWKPAALAAAELPLYAALLWWAVSRFGVAGAAAAWGVRCLVDSVAQHAIASRTVPVDAAAVVRTAGCFAALALFGWVCAAHLDGSAPALRVVAGCALGGAAAAWLVRAEDLDSLRRALR